LGQTVFKVAAFGLDASAKIDELSTSHADTMHSRISYNVKVAQ